MGQLPNALDWGLLPWAKGEVAVMTAKNLLWTLAPGLLRRIMWRKNRPEFTIGIARGKNLDDLARAVAAARPVLSREQINDLPAGFVADPFMIHVDGVWHMFFEIMNLLNHKGCIGHATSIDGQLWNYSRVVLIEPYHIAFPHVFEHDGTFYMVPDTPGEGLVLYRATAFPNCWVYDRLLIDNRQLSDSSLFKYRNRWWLTAWEGRRNGQLRLYSAARLKDQWIEHPCSPILEPCDQRPGGRVLEVDGILYRFVQNAQGPYGSHVRMREIMRLTETEWKESDVYGKPLLQGSGSGWRRNGMHHIDLKVLPDQNIFACVDGVRTP